MSISAETRAFKWEKPRTKGLSGMNEGLLYAASVLVGSKVYILGNVHQAEWKHQAGLTGVICVDCEASRAVTYFDKGPYSAAHIIALYEDALYVYGGMDSNAYSPSKVSRFDLLLRKFEPCEIRNDILLPFKYCSGAVLEDRGEWVIFGGEDVAYQLTNTLFVLDLDVMEWRLPTAKGSPPDPRYASAHCLHGHDFYICGGVEAHGSTFDLFILHCCRNNFKWSRVEANGYLGAPMHSHAMTQLFGKLFVYGGTPTGSGALFVYDISDRRWSKVKVVESREDQEKHQGEYTIHGRLPYTIAHTMLTTRKGLFVIGGTATEWRFINAEL